MKRFVIAAAVLSLAVAAAAFAADSGTAPKGPNMSFEERKAEVLKHIDTRVTSLQEEKTCVQAAKTQDELRACKQKHHADMDHMRGEHGKGCGKCGCKDGPCGPGRMPAGQ
jgi:Spy/CpxP family protein refolding chaperone